ncbi:hypothetical protein PV327_010428 [Microctonus hyperodae]|uniref:Receptor-type tyrosine-protein phosphatase N2 n=1 Tax=Microctonus hyperodae TaxID=165561 RepID=A0AA39FRW5_MICHY|nr:hypothetical protein PV327_010428 [Microctonus hyperodae]
MLRVRPRIGLVLLLAIILIIRLYQALSHQRQCCLFDENIYAAFGRCIPSEGVTNDDLYQYDLNPDELELLREELEKLVNEKYDWSHLFTQCVMQNALYSIRYRTEYDEGLCENLNEFETNSFAQFIDDDKPEVDEEKVRPLAMVNFVPSRGHGYGEFANEIYYPPDSSSLNHENVQLNDEVFDDPYSIIERKPERHPTLNFNNNNNNDENDNDDMLIIEPNDLTDSKLFDKYSDDELYDFTKQVKEQVQDFDATREIPPTMFRSRRNKPRKDVTRSFGAELTDYLEFLRGSPTIKQDEEIDSTPINSNLFPRKINRSVDKMNTPGIEDMDKLEFLQEGDENRNKFQLNDEESDEKNDNEEIVKSRDIFSGLLNENEAMPMAYGLNGFHTEDGFVQSQDLPDIYREEQENIELDDLPAFFWSRELSGFKRPERLDVKKPGPFYSTNNYAFKSQTSLPADNNEDNEENEVKDVEVELRQPFVKKELIAGKDITHLSMGTETMNSHENVDMDFVYIQFNEEFHKWPEGEAVVEKISELLGMNPGDFSSTRVGRAEVTFKVNKNVQNINAKDVVLKLDGIRMKLRETMNVNIIKAGIGDKVKLPPMLEVVNVKYSMTTTVFGLLVAAGVGVTAAAAIFTLLIARRHAKTRAKLARLATPDPEASKDYQELCRARMQAKQLAEKPESPRIKCLSRESESNRSSTSSWNGDEAASLSNMEISTGHMVLSYMEDHLKNKDKLDQEWAAICAYEADPSSIKIATDKSNAQRNRPGSALPYDHSRIILNDLSNIINSDYINASTITDHDPRNPAYIATQGPLPQTSADFWQLVWEQGSVVIVMLTRLTEEGRAMCYRYWPEEGSEHYHIYEVHLVSEHIWCDDYLVRSFYLKNLRTGETRTVTQFHFLSWPENGVPQSTKALLEFRRKVNKSYRGRSCPIVVHCSDGAGRTGTYCLIDMVLNRMAKGAKEIDIAAALEHIRDQRPGMVAVKQQFEFVLVAIAEEVHAILKALPVQSVDKSQISQANSGNTVEPPIDESEN